MPSFDRLQKRMDGKVVVLAVNYGEGEARINDFLAKYPAALTVLMDRDGSVAKTWKARVLPTTFVIDSAGPRALHRRRRTRRRCARLRAGAAQAAALTVAGESFRLAVRCEDLPGGPP